MTASYEQGLLTHAGELADAMTELGGSVARLLLGSARTAGLDPAVHAPLTGAALALGADQITVYTAGPQAGHRAHPDDITFLADVADAEDDARDLLTAAGKLAEQVTTALDTAHGDLDDALADLAAARAARDKDAAEDAAERAADARTRIGACDRALALLAEVDRRLRHAIARLQAVPTVLGETYESVYGLIRAGGRMPYEGRWITGEAPPARRRNQPGLGISPAALAARLLAAGWRELPGRPGVFRVFESPDRSATAAVPLRADLADYAMWLGQALAAIVAWQRRNHQAAAR